MCMDPLRYIFAQPGISCINDCFTLRFGLFEGHSCTTGEGNGEKK
jgi:hypothetical protein